MTKRRDKIHATAGESVSVPYNPVASYRGVIKAALALVLLLIELWAVWENKKRIDSMHADKLNRVIVVSAGKARVVVECQNRTRQALNRLGVQCPRRVR